MEQVDDDAFISNEMLEPSLPACDMIIPAIGLGHLHIWLLLLPIEVFREEIQNGVNTLLRVMLAVPLELLSILTEDPLEHGWSHH